MPKHSRNTKTERVVNARLKQITSKKKSNEQAKKAVALALLQNPTKKQRPTLKPPPPSKSNQLDTVGRMHLERSAAGYSVGYAAKGPPSSKDKPFTLPLEERVTNTNDLKWSTELGTYGMVKRKEKGSDNLAKQFRWVTKTGEAQWADWKVSKQ